MEAIILDQGMIVSGIVLAVSFIFIFTETVHGSTLQMKLFKP